MTFDRTDLAAELVGAAEIKTMYEAKVGRAVSKPYISKLMRHPLFPAPVAELAAGPIHLRQEVQAFLDLDRPQGRHLSRVKPT